MSRSEWVWMPHPAHFILGERCRFRLATYVGGFIVSTVGELWHDSRTREIIAEYKGIKIEGMGDAWDADYMKKIGFDELGYKRLYESMVFRAKKSDLKCCPWTMISGMEEEARAYNTPENAVKGHMELCEKWSTVDNG